MPDAPFTVPYPQHPHFVGREEDLARLHAALQEEGPVGINGQGGIGKTQLAVAYAYGYRQHYPDGVYWLNAAESLWLEFANLGRHFLGQGGEETLKVRLWETLRTRFSIEEIRDLCFDLGIDYEEFSPQLGISSLTREVVAYCQRRGQFDRLEGAVRRLRGELAQAPAQDELVLAAFTWLRQRPQSLLIFDNVADPAALDEPLTRDCVPGRLPGRVLFTTRRRDLGRFRPLEVKILKADAALRLLLRDPRRAPILDPTHAEHETARDICAVFGYLPLALEIAAAHLGKKQTRSLSDYYRELRIHGALNVITNPHIGVSTRHETGLVAALTTQWNTLSEEAKLILRVASQFREGIYIPTARIGLLAGLAEQSHGFFDTTLADALVELEDASLTEELASEQVRLHPLVRAFAQAQVTHTNEFCEACIRRLLAAYSDFRTLEKQCAARGIDALMDDLFAAEMLFTRDTFLHDTRIELTNAIHTYLRVFRREAHNLRGWRSDEAPGYLAQQLYLRLLNNDTPILFGDLKPHLRKHGLAWLLRWEARRESPELEMMMAGHSGSVNAVAVTLNGRWIISGGADGTLRVWNANTGMGERTLTGHNAPVLAVAVTPDGRRLVSSGADGDVRIWNVYSGASERVLIGHEGNVNALTITPDGLRLISGADDRTLRVWNLETGQSERILTGHRSRVLCVAITPDGLRVISGANDMTLRIWNLETGQSERTLGGHRSRILSVAATPDGQRAVSADQSGRVNVWNLSSGKREQRFEGKADAVQNVVTLPNGWQAVSSEGALLRIWSLNVGRRTWTLAGHSGRVLSITTTRDGRWIISGGTDGIIRVWNYYTDQSERMVTAHAGRVNTVAVMKSGQQAITGGNDRTLCFWNLDTGECERVLTRHKKWVNCLSVTPDGQHIITGGEDRMLHIWNFDANIEGGKRGVHTCQVAHRIRTIAVTRDGKRLIVGGRGGMLSVLDLHTGMIAQTLTGHSGTVQAVAILSNEDQFISCGDSGLLVWDLDIGQVLQTLTCHSDWTQAVAVTPDGQRVVSGGSDQTLRVWNLFTGTEEGTLTGHEGEVRAVAVTTDGQRAVSGGGDRTLRMWDLYTGRELGRVALDAAVTCLAVAPTQPTLVVAGDAAGGVYCLEWVE